MRAYGTGRPHAAGLAAWVRRRPDESRHRAL